GKKQEASGPQGETRGTCRVGSGPAAPGPRPTAPGPRPPARRALRSGCYGLANPPLCRARPGRDGASHRVLRTCCYGLAIPPLRRCRVPCGSPYGPRSVPGAAQIGRTHLGPETDMDVRRAESPNRPRSAPPPLPPKRLGDAPQSSSAAAAQILGGGLHFDPPVVTPPFAALDVLVLLVTIEVAGTFVLDAHLPFGPGEVGLAEAGAAGAEEDVQVR